MSYLFSMFIGFLGTIVSLILLRPLALRVQLIDIPNNRKHHQNPTPLIGGLAMFIGFLAALLTLPISLQDYRSLIAGCGLLVFIGVLDDFHELSAKSRFLAQIFALLLMFFWGGIKLTYLGDLIFSTPLFLGIYSLPVTLIAGLGIINAINMTDGVDGLAGTLVLTELILLAYCTAVSGYFISMGILLLIMATVLAFLIFNFRFPGRVQSQVFMGDAGSMFLGFTLVWFLIQLSQPGSKIVTPVTMLWIMGIPLFDTTAVMLYRVCKKRSIFSSDRQHVHHLLLRLNMSPAQISISLGMSNLVLGTLGLLANHYQLTEGIMFFGFVIFCVMYLLGIYYLRYKLSQQKNSLVFAQLLSKN